ncbi:hypothetical protein [Streptomyces sp. NPDC010273]|uniref:hypothetical protein n=1 Tax=Streptomyces sp. NPDC010273 TaxID=3364829 RepID=UPI0036EA25FB
MHARGGGLILGVGAGHELPLVEGLDNLDDEYDVLEYGDRTQAEVDADVTTEALRLAQHPCTGEPKGAPI